MDELGSKQQTKLHNDNSRSRLSIRRKLFWAELFQSHNNTENNNYKQRHKHNKHLLKLISICLLGTASPTFASDIGGVSATANPVAHLFEVTSDQSSDSSFTSYSIYYKHLW